MNITGQARLDGLMTIDLLNGYVPQVGNAFEIMTFAGESGTFSNVVGLPINDQEHFNAAVQLQQSYAGRGLRTIAGDSALHPGSDSEEPFIADRGGRRRLVRAGVSPGSYQTTPEPGSLVLFGSGDGVMRWLGRREMNRFSLRERRRGFIRGEALASGGIQRHRQCSSRVSALHRAVAYDVSEIRAELIRRNPAGVVERATLYPTTSSEGLASQFNKTSLVTVRVSTVCCCRPFSFPPTTIV